jgi:sec-independent protein translocase protein TatA
MYLSGRLPLFLCTAPFLCGAITTVIESPNGRVLVGGSTCRGERIMPNLGIGEWLIILVVVIIIFGVGRLPEVGSALGKAIRGFKKSVSSDDDKEKEAPPAQSEDPVKK